jgi:hypothetical protein
MAKADRLRRGDWNDPDGAIAVCADCECAFRTEREPGLLGNRIFCVVCDGVRNRADRRYAEQLDGLAHTRFQRRIVTPEQRIAEEAAKDIIRREEFAEIERQLKGDKTT